ncbi:hypothetical protein TPHA_0J02390 [Tetrapisispora phaffii CBS 4417]|uniref:GP-PDE domain-containing protein n=1 Tax=Tetrapisispora phaffii (strain ATCC 24235 / CBS 4417 / NBRC 1672 / NRRL Y-8282 / UCD 70-5) TaxID=1071381 RepID=G8BYW7_TETPH|nr:hypothetical protein TPHA_0J02390 [Tetrapisispora phaffii CBS 4417]CCE65059.1 hypothetical protein TPHA_0J02390 [Tetrapisispora phaffii CBS 4417]
MLEIVGHRAYKGKYPENTLPAYENAYNVNADYIETDLQMTSDGVVVVNHDADTGRMWDKNLVIAETLYKDIKELRCKTNKKLKMLTLVEMLEWCVAHPHAKIMLDIKFTNKKVILVKAFSAMRKVKDDIKFWQQRIMWGIWKIDWYHYGVETGVLENFKFICIVLDLDTGREFIQYSLDLNSPSYKLYGISTHFSSTWTDKYLKDMVPLMKKQDIKVYVWTINKEIDIKLILQIPSVHGIVTDDPLEARKLVEKYHKVIRPKKVFSKPSLLSEEGFRFYSLKLIYSCLLSIALSKWAHIKFFDVSFVQLLLLFMRLIGFV